MEYSRQILVNCCLQQNWPLSFYLHDAVYLYLLTLNQTLAEGNLDYRDGRLIRNKTIGQRFVGKRIYSKQPTTVAGNLLYNLLTS